MIYPLIPEREGREREGVKEKHLCETNINQLPPAHVCALIKNRTCDLSVQDGSPTN